MSRVPAKITQVLANDRVVRAITRALPKGFEVDRYLRVAENAWNDGGSRMSSCSVESFLWSVMQACQLGLGLEPQRGHCYIIPRGRVATFQLGYRGMIELVTRATGVSISAEVAYASDEFFVELGTERKIVHRPTFSSERGEVVAAYATAFRDGMCTDFRVISMAEIEMAARRSGNPRDSKWSPVWQDNFDEMARKTAVRRLCKYLPMAAEFEVAVGRDEAVERGEVVTTSEEADFLTAFAEEPATVDALLGDGDDHVDAEIVDG